MQNYITQLGLLFELKSGLSKVLDVHSKVEAIRLCGKIVGAKAVGAKALGLKAKAVLPSKTHIKIC